MGITKNRLIFFLKIWYVLRHVYFPIFPSRITPLDSKIQQKLHSPQWKRAASFLISHLWRQSYKSTAITLKSESRNSSIKSNISIVRKFKSRVYFSFLTWAYWDFCAYFGKGNFSQNNVELSFVTLIRFT